MPVQAQTQPGGAGEDQSPQLGLEPSTGVGWAPGDPLQVPAALPAAPSPRPAPAQLPSDTGSPARSGAGGGQGGGRASMVPLGKPESGAGSAYSPSIIQEPEQDKAEEKRGPTQQGERRGSGHHDAALGLRFHIIGDPFESCPMGKRNYLTPNHSLSCPEPRQGPRRPALSQPHCIPPVENMEKDLFGKQPSGEAGLGGQGGNPPCLGLRSGPESLTSLSKPHHEVPMLRVREERENTVSCSSTRGQAEPKPPQHPCHLTGLPTPTAAGPRSLPALRSSTAPSPHSS